MATETCEISSMIATMEAETHELKNKLINHFRFTNPSVPNDADAKPLGSVLVVEEDDADVSGAVN